MPLLHFPTDRIVGTVEWDGSWSDERGPVLAAGPVDVPDGAAVSLDAQAVLASEPTGGGGWTIVPAQGPLDLGFLRELPADVLTSLSVRSPFDAASLGAAAHLAPGLRRLYLGWTGLTDAVLPIVARLTDLIYLQTFGNHFTDHGVQQLAALTKLCDLYLEEETLSLAAFDFVDRLPQLRRLGLQDVPLTQHEINLLRARLPGVDVG